MSTPEPVSFLPPVAATTSAMSALSSTTTSASAAQAPHNNAARTRSASSVSAQTPQTTQSTKGFGSNSKAATTSSMAAVSTDSQTEAATASTRKSAPQHAAQVTPTDHTEDLNIFSNKQVRFTGKEDGALASKEVTAALDNAPGNDSTSSSIAAAGKVGNGGFVSKRGRYVSPGRRTAGSSVASSYSQVSTSVSTSPSSPSDTSSHRPSSAGSTITTAPSHTEASTSSSVVEYKTYRSPDNSTVPSLCSAPSQEDDSKEPGRDMSKSPAGKSDAPAESTNRGKSPTGLFLLSPSAAADRDRYVGASTPTDFTTDYKQIPAASFDTSNVLAWLQSPTANGFLFSPGFGSMLNTPNYKQSQHSTAPTPIVSTSFFFSDVASLPKQPQTPAGGNSTGNSNIICISPLASKKQSQQTPVDLKEIFASPDGRKFRGSTTTSKDAPSLDAVVLAERDVMEDDDLNVLLQLASNTTPRGNVFRSTPRKPLNTTKEEEGNNNLPGLQLPMIGGGRSHGIGPKARLSQKSIKSDDFAPPQLGMRSSSTAIASTKEIYAGGLHKNKENGKKAMARSTSLPLSGSGYPMYPPPDHSSYYPIPLPNIPPGMPPGSMHISMGGPPPTKKPKSGKNSPPRSSSYPDFHNGGAYPQPPHHMFPPAPYGVMGYPPYNTGHYPPPPRHLSMYGAAQQSTASGSSSLINPLPTGGTGTGNSSSSGNSRSSDKTPTEPTAKKRNTPVANADNQEQPKRKKKSPSSTGATPGKKKNKSPVLTDRVERQKAADAIQNLNEASGCKNDKAAALAAAILRGVTMRPSGKWQAQLYFAGKSRYIGVFDTREKAALAYEIAREKLKTGHVPGLDGASTENLVNLARKAAFDGVNERLCSKKKDE